LNQLPHHGANTVVSQHGLAPRLAWAAARPVLIREQARSTKILGDIEQTRPIPNSPPPLPMPGDAAGGARPPNDPVWMKATTFVSRPPQK